MIRIVIGTEANQYAAQKVLECSIRENTKKPVEIRFLTQDCRRVGGTNFGFVRFQVPKLFNYEGRAIYLDADQVVLADIEGLWDSLGENFAVALVQNPAGSFGGKEIKRGNQTSVMVLDCAKLRDWDPGKMFDCVIPNREELRPGKIHYRDFMMLSWMDSAKIQELDNRWNCFNVVLPETKLVHFSHVRSQPWKDPSHICTSFWKAWLVKAMRRGFLKRRELVQEILRGHVHASFLSCILKHTREPVLCRS